MTQPTRHQYRPGTRILAEGVVTGYDWGEPFGAVRIMFPAATDPSHLLDGVEIIQPQALCFIPGVDIPLGDYVAEEGFYEDVEDE